MIFNMKEEIIISDNLKLVAVNSKYAAEKYIAIKNSYDSLLPWLEWVHFYDDAKNLKEGEEKVANYQTKKAEEFKCGQSFLYDIFYDGHFAGGIEIMHISYGNRVCEFGYWLNKDYTKKGIMTRAVNKLTEEVFSELKMHCVIILAAHKNTASRAVAERCGFRLEATLREQILLGGKYYDKCVYTKLESD